MNAELVAIKPIEEIRRESLRSKTNCHVHYLVADYLATFGHGVIFDEKHAARVLTRLPDPEGAGERGYCVVCRQVRDLHGCTYGQQVFCMKLNGDSFMAVEMFCRGPWK